MAITQPNIIGIRVILVIKQQTTNVMKLVDFCPVEKNMINHIM